MKPLALTGVGVVSPLGIGREAFFAALSDPKSAEARAFRTPAVLDAEKFRGAKVAEISDWDAKAYLGDKGLRNIDRLTTFLIVAARRCLEDAGLKKDGVHLGPGGERIGICSSTAYGSLDAITELNLVAELEDPRYINPARFPNAVINAAAGYVSIWEDLRAPNMTVVNGNCGGLDVVLSAATHLAHRRGEAFLVGGGEVITEPLYLAFQKLGIVGDGADGSGVHLGEGAAYVMAERTEDAVARGAKVLGEITGYANTFGPPESEALVTGASAATVEAALRAALRDAGVEAGQVDVVCGSRGGAAAVDDAELEAVKRVFGAGAALAAPKRIFGETFGAGGAFGMAAVLAWMEGAPVGPMAVGEAPSRVATAVVLTVGYYGNVSAVVMRRPR